MAVATQVFTRPLIPNTIGHGTGNWWARTSPVIRAIQPARLQIPDRNHPATSHLPAAWERTDEWYNFRMAPSAVGVLIRIDESSYSGGTHGADHPMAWYHKLGSGRAFYTALGHTEESYDEPLFLEHLLGGIRYAARLTN